jgi:hypothetical protein
MFPVFFWGTSIANYGGLYCCTVVVAETASETFCLLYMAVSTLLLCPSTKIVAQHISPLLVVQ